MGRLNQRRGDGDGALPEGWSQPEADHGGDPWRAPGHTGPVGNTQGFGNAAYPFECSVCHANMRIEGAYVKNGSTYCFQCRPEGATSSADLPPNDDLHLRGRNPSLLRKLLAALTARIR